MLWALVVAVLTALGLVGDEADIDMLSRKALGIVVCDWAVGLVPWGWLVHRRPGPRSMMVCPCLMWVIVRCGGYSWMRMSGGVSGRVMWVGGAAVK